MGTNARAQIKLQPIELQVIDIQPAAMFNQVHRGTSSPPVRYDSSYSLECAKPGRLLIHRSFSPVVRFNALHAEFLTVCSRLILVVQSKSASRNIPVVHLA